MRTHVEQHGTSQHTPARQYHDARSIPALNVSAGLTIGCSRIHRCLLSAISKQVLNLPDFTLTNALRDQPALLPHSILSTPTCHRVISRCAYYA